MNTHVVKSLKEYIALMKDINEGGKELWLRGQSNTSYLLLPSALREVYAIEDARGYKIDPPKRDNVCSGSNNILAYLPVAKMVEEFKKEAEEHLEYKAETMVEWECIAQHYGIPTRMLEWTTNAINALYFAVCDCKIGKVNDEDIDDFLDTGFSEGGGAVFIIDPLEINVEVVPDDDFAKNPYVFDAINDAELISHCMDSIIPVLCLSGFNKEKRISRQSGKFSMTGKLLWPMDYISVLTKKMHKIFIPYNCYEDIRKELFAIGINHDTIYVEDDEKDKIAKEIAEKTKNNFKARMIKGQ